MRIGILTLPFNNNYGGYLQAYALMTVLKQMGHEVELIYRKHNKRTLLKRITLFVKSLLRFLLHKQYCCIIPNQEKELRYKGQNMMEFVDNYISPKTAPIYSSTELKSYSKNYDAIIVGSDQVWRADYVPNIEDFFLGFTNGTSVKRIAYAASFGGNPHYSYDEITKCGDLITKYNYISLREESGIEVFNRYKWKTKEKPIVVLDPTMLLPPQNYEKLFHVKSAKTKYISSYVLDECPETQKLVAEVTEILHIPEKKITDSHAWGKKGYKLPSINYWLESIHNATFIITDSFHGTVFSIIFNKPFIVYANIERGIDRFETLLLHFGLENRLMTNVKDIETIVGMTIDWHYVNNKIKRERERSLYFLRNSLIE